MEGGGAGGHLIDDATRDHGGTSRANENAAGAQAELHPIGDGQTGPALDGERVALGVERDSQITRARRGEQHVRIRRHALGSAAEEARIDLILPLDVQRAEVIDTGVDAGGRERKVRVMGARVIQVDDGPR